MISLIDRLRDFISQCPFIRAELPFYLDYVEDGDCYCVALDPNVPYRKDILGNKIYTVTFQFALRATISDDRQRGDNAKFFEDFCRWIDAQNIDRSFPVLADNEEPRSLRVVDTASLDEVSEDRVTGIYTAKLQFIYKERVF